MVLAPWLIANNIKFVLVDGLYVRADRIEAFVPSPEEDGKTSVVLSNGTELTLNCTPEALEKALTSIGA